MEGVSSGLRIAANQNAKEYLTDPRSRALAIKDFEAAGYSPDAVEAEAFQRSLAALATIENLIVSAQRRLMSFLKELDSRYGSGAAEMRLTAMNIVTRVSRQED
jgi:hypothetical protein